MLDATKMSVVHAREIKIGDLFIWDEFGGTDANTEEDALAKLESLQNKEWDGFEIWPLSYANKDAVDLCDDDLYVVKVTYE